MCGNIHLMKNGADVDFAGSSIAIGVFDGVHKGHRYLIEQAKASAAATDGKSIVLTFSVDPDELFGGVHPMKLMTNSERLFALAKTDVDAVAVLPFDYEFAAMPPEDFLEWVFGQSVPCSIHVGSGFRFGRAARGTVRDLKAWGKQVGTEIVVHPLLRVGGMPISSTRVRRLFVRRRIAEAYALLGYTG